MTYYSGLSNRHPQVNASKGGLYITASPSNLK